MSTSTVLVSGGGSSSSGSVSVSGGSVSVGGSSSAGGGSASAGAGAGSSVAAGVEYDLEGEGDYKDLEFKEEHIGGDFLDEYDSYTDYGDEGKVLPAVIYEDLKEVHRV